MPQEDFYNLVIHNQQNNYIVLIVIGVAVCCCFIYMVFRDMFGK